MSRIQKHAWKVVRVTNDGQFFSTIWLPSVVYSTKQWVKPDKSQNQFLFVFKTRNQAREYLNDTLRGLEPFKKFRIFKCKVRNMNSDRIVISPRGDTYSLRKAWSFPKGTMFADSVKLIK